MPRRLLRYPATSRWSIVSSHRGTRDRKPSTVFLRRDIRVQHVRGIPSERVTFNTRVPSQVVEELVPLVTEAVKYDDGAPSDGSGGRDESED